MRNYKKWWKLRIMKIAKTRKIIAYILNKNQVLKMSKSAKTTRFTNLNNKYKYKSNTRTAISNCICIDQDNLLCSQSGQCANIRKTSKLNANIVRGYILTKNTIYLLISCNTEKRIAQNAFSFQYCKRLRGRSYFLLKNSFRVGVISEKEASVSLWLT